MSSLERLRKLRKSRNRRLSFSPVDTLKLLPLENILNESDNQQDKVNQQILSEYKENIEPSKPAKILNISSRKIKSNPKPAAIPRIHVLGEIDPNIQENDHLTKKHSFLTPGFSSLKKMYNSKKTNDFFVQKKKEINFKSLIQTLSKNSHENVEKTAAKEEKKKDLKMEDTDESEDVSEVPETTDFEEESENDSDKEKISRLESSFDFSENHRHSLSARIRTKDAKSDFLSRRLSLDVVPNSREMEIKSQKTENDSLIENLVSKTKEKAVEKALKDQNFAGKKKLNVKHRQTINLKRGIKYKRKRLPGVMASNMGRKHYSKYSAKFTRLAKKKIEAEDENSRLYCDVLSVDDLEETLDSISENEDESRKKTKLDNKKIEKIPFISDLKNTSHQDCETILKQHFDLKGFRDGQFDVIRTILEGDSCLAIMPTGAGKSLCYQFPAFVKPGLTIVVTPLISLMQDQMKNLPRCLKGAVWNSSQDEKAILETIKSLRSGETDVLYVSPERFSSFGFKKVIMELPKPGVSFVCIDEAHCLSEWSHNFRPTYLMLNKIIREEFGINSILAMTATATIKSKKSICNTLSIPESNLVESKFRRNNLSISVSEEDIANRKSALICLLKSNRFRYLSSIIVYVQTRASSGQVASFLRAAGFDAMAYHAGMWSLERKKTQKKFMKGKTRIIVATVAFGMGMNKSDVRAVIHYEPPRTIENYTQEIGRAGRDSNPGECHCFFSEKDFNRARSLAFSKSISLEKIKFIMEKVFLVGKKDYLKKGSYSVLRLQELEAKTDTDSSVITTIASHLKNVEHIPNIHSRVLIGFLDKPSNFEDTTGVSSSVINYVLKNGKKCNGNFRIELLETAKSLEIGVSQLQRVLLRLKVKHKIWLKWEKFSYCVKLTENIINSRLVSKRETSKAVEKYIEHESKRIYRKMESFEERQLLKTNILCQIFKKISSQNFESQCSEKRTKSNAFFEALEIYFDCEEENEYYESLEKESKKSDKIGVYMISDIEKKEIKESVCNVIDQNEKLASCAISIAKILHGIQTKKNSSSIWKKCSEWRKFIHVPFPVLRNCIKQQLKLN